MTVVVLGLDALDPDLVDSVDHPNLTLDAHASIETVLSSATDEPSTHELWPTIITGLLPDEHGLQLESGISWESPIINLGSTLATAVLPKNVRSILGAWLLNNTDEVPFRTPVSYYTQNGLSTLFDNISAETIGIPNYVVNPDLKDREHELRGNLGDLFQHDPTENTKHKHSSSNPREFYQLCLEMSMIRIARARRAVRRREYELIFGYTSGLDLVGHIAYENPALQMRAYEEIDEFVGELRKDLRADDELVLISDHGLQDGVHTNEAMVASTDAKIVKRIDSVLDFRRVIEDELADGAHRPQSDTLDIEDSIESDDVQQQLKDLGYM
jgi:predicted AlkP superfamily pyrophosphatase or phosphodiesterase